MSESSASPVFSCLLGFTIGGAGSLIEDLFGYGVSFAEQFFGLEDDVIESRLEEDIFIEISVLIRIDRLAVYRQLISRIHYTMNGKIGVLDDGRIVVDVRNFQIRLAEESRQAENYQYQNDDYRPGRRDNFFIELGDGETIQREGIFLAGAADSRVVFQIFLPKPLAVQVQHFGDLHEIAVHIRSGRQFFKTLFQKEGERPLGNSRELGKLVER